MSVPSDRQPIRAWDYRAEYEVERDDILDAVDTVFRSGRLILGEGVRAFEREFAEYCGVAHGVGVANGTDGLTLALRAFDIGAGDEVITVANTAVPTVSAIVAAGATPRFVDIDADTYLMDIAGLEAAATDRIRAIIPVHLYGQCVDMEAVSAFAARRNLRVIEDCAQAHGAVHRGMMAGSFGDAGVFSFYPTKTLGAYGDGGMVVTRDAVIADRLRRIRFYGMEKRYVAEEDGVNSRLDEVQAEILRRKLTRLPSYLRSRRAIAAVYDKLLAETGLVLPRSAADNDHSFHQYVVRHPARDDIIMRLEAEDIHLEICYPYPIHTMPAFQRYGYGDGDLPVTEMMARQVFSLPIYPTFSAKAQRVLCEALVRILS